MWNALDADAERVEVLLHRNDADGIEGVIVRDTGRGMSAEAAESDVRDTPNSGMPSRFHSQLLDPFLLDLSY